MGRIRTVFTGDVNDGIGGGLCGVDELRGYYKRFKNFNKKNYV